MFKAGFAITMNVFRYIFRHPKIIMPELFSSLLSLLIAGVFVFHYRAISDFEAMDIAIFLGILFVISMLNGFAAYATLVMVKDTMEERKPRLLRAMGVTLMKLHHLIPIMIVSIIGKFIISLIGAILRGGRKPHKVSFGSGIIRQKEAFFKRGFRMFIFIMLSIEAFEAITFREIFSKARKIVRERLWLFTSGIVLVKMATALFAIIPILIILLSVFVFETINIETIIGVFIYFILFGALITVVEVIYISQLYLWNERWEKLSDEAIEKGENIPNIHDVEQPDLLKDIHNDTLLSEYDTSHD